MKTAIVYQYLAHYRLPVFRKLMESKEIEYTLISDFSSNDGIKTIDIDLAEKSVESGGLRWRFVKNKWLVEGKFLWQKNLLSILQKEDFDKVILLGNVYYLSTWLAVFILKVKKKKIYFWTHGVTSDAQGLKWYIRKLFYNLGDAVLLYGNRAKEAMIKNGFPGHKLHVIYNSLDYDQQVTFRKKITPEVIARTKQELFKNHTLPYIVFVGRLTNQKKLDMIVDAVHLLAQQGIKMNTLFVGKGDIQQELEILISNYQLNEYFNFYGPCYEEEKLSHLIGSADVCVSPGEVGLTAMTALGYGTPVISHSSFNHQMPEYESIIPEYNGDLFLHASIESLTEKVKTWLIQSKDIPRHTIQERCFEVIDKKYNPSNQAEIINRILLKDDKNKN